MSERVQREGDEGETYVHLEDAADPVDGHPDKVLAVVICEQEDISMSPRRKPEGRKRTALVKHLDKRPQPLTTDEHLKLHTHTLVSQDLS